MSSYETVLLNRYKDLEEISIRQEVDDFFSGFDYGEEKENTFVIQRIRRNENNVAKHCPKCWDNLRNEGKPGCPSCFGLGYQFDESLSLGYMTPLQHKKLSQSFVYQEDLGRSIEVLYGFYTRYKPQLFDGDIVLKPKLTDEGFIDMPLKYVYKYVITSNYNYRLDEGRSEYNFYTALKVQ